MTRKHVPKVSVVIPTCNHANFIEECICNIMSQDYPEVELIVIDDNPEDDNDTELVVERLLARYDFQYVQGSAGGNMGSSEPRNRGIEMATGEYVVAFDSDDIMAQGAIAKQVAFLERRPDVGICGGNAVNIDKEGKLLLDQKSYPYKELCFDDLFQLSWTTSNFTMMRKKILDRIGGYAAGLICCEDVDIALRTTHAGYKYVHFEDVFYYHRTHSSNISKNRSAMVASLIKVFDMYKDHHNYKNLMDRFCARHFPYAARHNRALARDLLPRFRKTRHPFRFIKGWLRLMLK